MTTTKPFALDPIQQRMMGDLTDRHMNKAIECAEHIEEYVGYLLRDLRSGDTLSTYAPTILTDAQEIIRRLGILEGVKDSMAIVAARDESTPEGDPR